MSLHERFTKLKFDGSRASLATSQAVAAHKPAPVKSEVIDVEEYNPRDNYSLYSRGRNYSPAAARPTRGPRPRTRTPDQPRYSARRMRSLSPVSRHGHTYSPEHRRSAYKDDRSSSNLFSTHRVKKKSVYLRLGVRPRSLADRMSDGIPVWAKPRQSGGGWSSGAGWGMSRSRSQNSLNRWSSQTSVNSGPDIPRYHQNNRRFNRGGRGGGRRNFAYNRYGRWRYGQGWFGRRNRGGGGGGYRGRGGRGGYRRQPPPRREDLDAELDKYMAGTRGVLDRDLDTYMSDNVQR